MTILRATKSREFNCISLCIYGHSKPARNFASQSNISDNNADHCMQISGGGIVCADGQFAEECLDTAAQTGMEGKHEDD